MEHEKEELLRQYQLQFIGKVLSVFTHELNNHLAIIKESVGLIEDILQFQKSFTKYDIDKSLKILQSIENQIAKTSWISKKLNSFGHRMDKPLSAFSLNECLEELLVFLNRIATQKKVSFKKEFQDDIPITFSDSAKLQFMVFCIIDKNLKMLDKDSNILLKTTHSHSTIKIDIIPEGNSIETNETEICPEEIVKYVVKLLGGSIENRKDKGISIMLPVKKEMSV